MHTKCILNYFRDRCTGIFIADRQLFPNGCVYGMLANLLSYTKSRLLYLYLYILYLKWRISTVMLVTVVQV